MGEAVSRRRIRGKTPTPAPVLGDKGYSGEFLGLVTGAPRDILVVLTDHDGNKFSKRFNNAKRFRTTWRDGPDWAIVKHRIIYDADTEEVLAENSIEHADWLHAPDPAEAEAAAALEGHDPEEVVLRHGAPPVVTGLPRHLERHADAAAEGHGVVVPLALPPC